MKQPVYKFTYTVDNRIKSVRLAEETVNEGDSSSWFVVAAGAVACVIWWFQW